MINPGKHDLEDFLQQNTQYRIPEFQRPYVWEREEQWQPLWNDIESVAERALEADPSDPQFRGHFLGAVVVKASSAAAGAVTLQEVIDGQQRLTTLILFLRAFRAVAEELGGDSQRLEDLDEILYNTKFRKRGTEHQWKVYPSEADQKNFFAVMRCASRGDLRQQMGLGPKAQWSGEPIVDSFLFFHEEIRSWILRIEDASVDRSTCLNRRIEALHGAVARGLRFISIRLDDSDDAQLIFETLNARGTPLLQGELVRNYLLRSIKTLKEAGGPDLPGALAEIDDHTDFWRQDVRQGRLHRPRIDLLLYYWMTIRTGDVHLVTSVFSQFQKDMGEGCLKPDLDALRTRKVGDPDPSLRTRVFVDEMNAYAKSYRDFMTVRDRADARPQVKSFFRRLEVLDTAAVMPVLLLCRQKLGDSNEFLEVLSHLESYLVRRVLCGASPKNLNRFVAGLVTKLAPVEGALAAALAEHLMRPGVNDVNRWPDDDEICRNLLNRDMYHFLSKSRLRMILEALNQALRTDKSEKVQVLDIDSLTVEHILPQGWEKSLDWKLPTDSREARDARMERVHRLGNLTLLTEKLNPSVSNAGWETKRKAFAEHSLLKMNQDLVRQERWDEAIIDQRSQRLYEVAKLCWPIPTKNGLA